MDKQLDNGWILKENGTYLGQDGTVLTARMYKRRVLDKEGDYASGLNEDYAAASRGSPEPAGNDEPGDFSMPSPKSKSTRATSSSGKATSKELTLAFETMFLIVTSMMALMSNFPDVAMTESEANSIAIPLGNILFDSTINKQFGKLIANSGDYSLLGYAVYLYLYRVANARREMIANGRSAQAPSASNGNPGGTGGGTGATGTVNGAFIPYRPSGIRGFVPPSQ